MLVNLAILLCESAVIVNWGGRRSGDAKLHKRDRKYCSYVQSQVLVCAPIMVEMRYATLSRRF